ALEALLQLLDRLVHLLLQRFDLRLLIVVLDREMPPLAGRVLAQHRLGDLGPALEALGPALRGLSHQELLEPALEAPLQDRALVVAVLGEALDLGPLD